MVAHIESVLHEELYSSYKESLSGYSKAVFTPNVNVDASIEAWKEYIYSHCTICTTLSISAGVRWTLDQSKEVTLASTLKLSVNTTLHPGRHSCPPTHDQFSSMSQFLGNINMSNSDQRKTIFMMT